MKAAVLHKPLDLRVQEVDDEPLAPGDVLISVEAALICGTDLRIVDGSKTRGVIYPSVLGHETAGRVLEVEPDAATTVRPGDLVAVYPLITCGTCKPCQAGMNNLCRNRQAFGYQHRGGFAERMRIPAKAVTAGNLVVLPDELGAPVAALAEPLSCCLNGLQRSNVGKDSVVLVAGAGPIGLMHLLLAKVLGARIVVVSEPMESRRATALQLGADAVVDPATDDVAEQVAELTGGTGVDAVILAVGVTNGVDRLAACLSPGGTLNLFAGFPPGASVALDPNLVHYGELTVTGASSARLKHFAAAADLLREGRIDASPLVTGSFGLDDTLEAFEAARQRSALRTAVAPNAG